LQLEWGPHKKAIQWQSLLPAFWCFEHHIALWVYMTLVARRLCIYPVYQGMEYKLFCFRNRSMCRIMTSSRCNCVPWLYTVKRSHSFCSIHYCAAAQFVIKHLPQKNASIFKP
jgi:hypothetical protein